MKYRKKPVVIDAIQWDGMQTTYEKIITELDPNKKYVLPLLRDSKIHIHTLEGDHEGRMGDWVIKGVNGELYPCKPDIFKKTYEPVTNEAKNTT